jgi:cytochrome c oxidase subunit 1
VVIGTEQINIIAHNTLRIPGHFHMTVVGGTALCFMGVTYYLLPLIFRRRIAFYKLAQAQPYMFGVGITMMGMFMTYAGSFGVPRRHWDISFTKAYFPFELPPVVDILMAGTALGGTLAFLGGISFVLIAVVSVFFGSPLSDEDLTSGSGAGLPSGVRRLPKQVHDDEAARAAHETGTPGTVILVIIFFACFVLYYFANWKILATLWKVG